jgi:hypothetical protein
MSAAIIDDGAGSPGAWRAAIEPNACCKGCGQVVCGHPDAVYQGIVPLRSVGG